LGYYGGRPLLERYRRFFRVTDSSVARAEGLFASYGAVTIFFARFVFGLRILAGPMAGVLRMPWKKFVTFNFLGAAVWVGAISGAGYFFGRHWGRLMRDLKRLDLAVALVIGLAIVFWWLRNRRRLITTRH
jgi:membrane protein DedA with SNARE-associated domain